MVDQILSGLFSVQTLIALLIGVCGGTVIGCLPGLSASMGVALLLPMTYSMDTIPAMVMLTAIYTCAIYGGSISAILIHTPGTPSSAASEKSPSSLLTTPRMTYALFPISTVIPATS